MNNSFYHNILFRKVSFLLGILLTGVVVASSFKGDNTRNNLFESSSRLVLPLPDSTFEDSTDVYQLYDTIYSYSDGGDSIYVVPIRFSLTQQIPTQH